MTVSELIRELRRLEADGMGELPVGAKLCHCNDSDQDWVDDSLYEVTPTVADADPLVAGGIAPGAKYVRLDF